MHYTEQQPLVWSGCLQKSLVSTKMIVMEEFLQTQFDSVSVRKTVVKPENLVFWISNDQSYYT